jgi:hypothetical protein
MSISATANTKKTFISRTPCWTHKPRSRESFHSLKRRRQSAQGRCDCWHAEGQAGVSFSLGGGFRPLEGCQRAALKCPVSLRLYALTPPARPSGIQLLDSVTWRGPEPATPPYDRDGVTRFQHRRKISSILIRNTVVPTAVRTTLGSCLAIEGVNHRKSGVVMSIIPMDVQRRCERRWAARFSRPTESVAPRRPERKGLQIAGPEPDKSKRKTHRVEAAGSRPLSAV